MTLEIIGGMITAIFALYGMFEFIKIVFKKPFERMRTPTVPDLKNIPPAPIQRFRRYQPTSEQKYGCDLLEIATRIYLEKVTIFSLQSDIKAKESAEEAERLISEVEKVCFEKDLKLAEKSAQQHDKFFQAMSK